MWAMVATASMSKKRHLILNQDYCMYCTNHSKAKLSIFSSVHFQLYSLFSKEAEKENPLLILHVQGV